MGRRVERSNRGRTTNQCQARRFSTRAWHRLGTETPLTATRRSRGGRGSAGPRTAASLLGAEIGALRYHTGPRLRPPSRSRMSSAGRLLRPGPSALRLARFRRVAAEPRHLPSAVPARHAHQLGAVLLLRRTSRISSRSWTWPGPGSRPRAHPQYETSLWHDVQTSLTMATVPLGAVIGNLPALRVERDRSAISGPAAASRPARRPPLNPRPGLSPGGPHRTGPDSRPRRPPRHCRHRGDSQSHDPSPPGSTGPPDRTPAPPCPSAGPRSDHFAQGDRTGVLRPSGSDNPHLCPPAGPAAGVGPAGSPAIGTRRRRTPCGQTSIATPAPPRCPATGWMPATGWSPILGPAVRTLPVQRPRRLLLHGASPPVRIAIVDDHRPRRPDPPELTSRRPRIILTGAGHGRDRGRAGRPRRAGVGARPRAAGGPRRGAWPPRARRAPRPACCGGGGWSRPGGATTSSSIGKRRPMVMPRR